MAEKTATKIAIINLSNNVPYLYIKLPEGLIFYP